MKIIDYLVGYARRPYLWGDLLRQPLRLAGLQNPRETTGKEASEWAAQLEKPSNEIFVYLGVPEQSLMRFRGEHPDSADAERRAEKSNIRFGGPGHVDLLYTLVKIMRPHLVIETGVGEGWSSLSILSALNENNEGRLISIDRPDMRLENDDLVGFVVPVRLRQRWKLILGTDRDRLPKALANNLFDLAHYDSDKSYLGRSWALPIIWAHIRRGGVLICDDIGDNLGFRDFCISVRVEPLVSRIGTKFVGVIRHP